MELIVIALFIIGAVWFFWCFKPSKPKPVNLADPAQLRFIKDVDYDYYYVEFFNPAYDKWWTLPEIEAGCLEPWSFQAKGSYGAYDLDMMHVYDDEIPSIKNKYKTLANIEAYFIELRKEFDEAEERERKRKQKPQVIY